MKKNMGFWPFLGLFDPFSDLKVTIFHKKLNKNGFYDRLAVILSALDSFGLLWPSTKFLTPAKQFWVQWSTLILGKIVRKRSILLPKTQNLPFSHNFSQNQSAPLDPKLLRRSQKLRARSKKSRAI